MRISYVDLLMAASILCVPERHPRSPYGRLNTSPVSGDQPPE
jgi:hypothetical protein